MTSVRADFPILNRRVNDRPLIYLDNAASTQKPTVVIDTIAEYYRNQHANIHRGVHTLSQEATQRYEDARQRVARYIGAPETRGCVFVRGATEGINLVAQTWGRASLHAGDEILLTTAEHHANIVPWQILAEEKKLVVRVLPVTPAGEWDWAQIDDYLTPRTRLVAVGQVSNTLGTIHPVEKIIARARHVGATVLIDGAQSIAHFPVNVKTLDCDFFVFSGHKLFGPTGIGVLYGKPALLDAMPPYQGGGDMIRTVSFKGTTYREAPERFEAGTPNIAGTLGLAAALDYLTTLGHEKAYAHEQALLAYATERLAAIPGLTIIGTAPKKVAVISFTLDGIHPHDIGSFLDSEGIAIRTGHHCTMPLMEHYGITGTARASFAFYNTFAEVDHLTEALHKARRLFGL